MKIIQLGNMRKGTPKFSNPQTGRVYSIDGIAPTINTCQGESVNQRQWLRKKYDKNTYVSFDTK